MTTRKKRLGRGLDALLGGPGQRVDETVADASVDGELKRIPVEHLQRGRYQPRSDMRTETLEELAQSIAAQGVVQPIVVRPIPATATGVRYEIIAGERRWRAAQIAGLGEIPALIREVPDEAAVAMALIENIQRENLNPLEEARALSRLIEEFDMTHQAAATAVGRSRVAVSNLLRLLELDQEVKERLERRELEMGHARALLGLPPGAQREAARQVARNQLSVRATEQLARRLQKGEAPAPAPRPDPDIARLEADLADRLGAKVHLQHGKGGAGRLVISYHSVEELEGILRHFR
ncbi:MAG: ParB/RepB/Spo0J family partition protein [Gammaproteobacteria bacterium]|nr:ParB/RepB/Spo0J family partition protein [Gammaproteobacteria bacterium]